MLIYVNSIVNFGCLKKDLHISHLNHTKFLEHIRFCSTEGKGPCISYIDTPLLRGQFYSVDFISKGYTS